MVHEPKKLRIAPVYSCRLFGVQGSSGIFASDRIRKQRRQPETRRKSEIPAEDDAIPKCLVTCRGRPEATRESQKACTGPRPFWARGMRGVFCEKRSLPRQCRGKPIAFQLLVKFDPMNAQKGCRPRLVALGGLEGSNDGSAFCLCLGVGQ